MPIGRGKAAIGYSRGNHPIQPYTKDIGYPKTARYEKDSACLRSCTLRFWMLDAGGGLHLPAIGRDPSLRSHCFWRDTHLQRLPHRHRLPLPLQRIINLVPTRRKKKLLLASAHGVIVRGSAEIRHLSKSCCALSAVVSTLYDTTL